MTAASAPPSVPQTHTEDRVLSLCQLLDPEVLANLILFTKSCAS